MKNILFLVLSLVFLASCNEERKIRAMVWNTDVNEIWRKIEVDGKPKEEFIPTNDKRFLEFKALHNKDAETLIRAARRSCSPKFAQKFSELLSTPISELANGSITE